VSCQTGLNSVPIHTLPGWEAARPVFHRELRDAVMANILTQTGRLIGYEVV
jgi:hypothetical protein